MQRKTVTVLFCDVTGSTALGESVAAGRPNVAAGAVEEAPARFEAKENVVRSEQDPSAARRAQLAMRAALGLLLAALALWAAG